MAIRRMLAIALIAACVFAAGAVCFAAPELNGKTYMDVQIKKMFTEPSTDSEVVYEFPVDVRILAMTADRNWFRIRIEFDLLFLGHFKYTGWVYAPFGEITEKLPVEDARQPSVL